MTEYTVEVYGDPMKDSDFSQWRRALDVVPGTFLVEDITEPSLVFPVQAATLSEAAILITGVMAELGLRIAWGRAYPTEPESAVDPSLQVVIPNFVPSWLEDEAKTLAALASS